MGIARRVLGPVCQPPYGYVPGQRRDPHMVRADGHAAVTSLRPADDAVPHCLYPHLTKPQLVYPLEIGVRGHAIGIGAVIVGIE